MATTLPDTELVRQLYVNGLPMAEICRKTGVKMSTLSTWKRRYNWHAQKVVANVNEAPIVERVAKEVSAETLEICRNVLRKLREAHLGNIRDCKESASAVAAAYATARKALGMDEGAGAGRAINVSIYAQSPVQVQVGNQASDLQSEGQSAPVIDVEQVTEAPKQIPTTGPTTDAQEQPVAS